MALLPGGIKIKTGKLRGIESQGMMCSIDELGLKKKIILRQLKMEFIFYPKNILWEQI